MRLLLKAALWNSKHYILLFITIIAMILGTSAAKMEIFSLRVVLDTGADFFKLFKDENDKESRGSKPISLEDVQERWGEIEEKETGKVTLDSAVHYISKQKSGNILDRFSAFIKNYLNIPDKLLNLAIFIIIVASIKAITQFIQQFTFKVVGIRVSRDLRERYFRHIQSLPMSFYQKYDIGELSSRATMDAIGISEGINSMLLNYLETPFTLITALILCFITSWKLSLVIFIGGPLIVFPIVVLAKRIKRVSKQLQVNNEKFSAVLIDFLSGIQTIKAFVMELYSFKKYKDQNDQMAVLEEKNAKYSLAARPILHMLSSFLLGTIIVYGLYVETMEVSKLFFFCAMLYTFYMPIKRFADENAKVMKGAAAAERMFEVLHMKPQIVDCEDAIEMETLNSKIEFKDVWFKYDDDKPWVLKDLSFTVKRGETVAIVGSTGCGKSTVMQLLPRLYECPKGDILIDGLSVTKYTQNSLREAIAFVPQKPFLFADSVAGNISFGKDFSMEEIQGAAKKAHADEFIQMLPEKYEFNLLSTGRNLSGGQQQRVAIARALVKKAPVLLLDEATSALDNVSEEHIKEAIEELHGEITQIIVAHRLSTIQKADKIIYLENGQKIAEGTKDELLESCPEFKKMWDLNSSS